VFAAITDVAIARQPHGKHVFVAIDTDAITDVVFSMQSMPWLYSKHQLYKQDSGLYTVA
jgi:hypothetical protein